MEISTFSTFKKKIDTVCYKFIRRPWKKFSNNVSLIQLNSIKEITETVVHPWPKKNCVKTSQKGFSDSKCDIGNWIFSKS